MQKPAASSHMLDLEFSGRTVSPHLSRGKGIQVVCHRCGTVNVVPFFTTLRAWSFVLRKIAALYTSSGAPVTEQELLQQGSRPSASAQRALDLLVAIVDRLAESREEAKSWLLAVGFKPRWIRTTLSEYAARVPANDANAITDALKHVSVEGKR